MERDTGTGQNAQGGPAGYNMGINIIPPNINKKKGPTGINALYREITRQYMEEFYRVLCDKTYFSPTPDSVDRDYEEDFQHHDVPPVNDNTFDDICSMAPQNDAGYEPTFDEYYDKMAADEQYFVENIQMDHGSEPDPPGDES